MPRKLKPVNANELNKILDEESVKYSEPELDPNTITNERALAHWRSVRDRIVESGMYYQSDDLAWMGRNLHRLLNLSLSLSQLSVPVNEALPCKRVIKVKARIPKYIYNIMDIESVYLSNQYAAVDGLMLTPYQAEFLDKCRCITNDTLRELELPVEGYQYNVMRSAAGSRFVLAINDFNKYITHTCKWEYFDLTTGVQSLLVE